MHFTIGTLFFRTPSTGRYPLIFLLLATLLLPSCVTADSGLAPLTPEQQAQKQERVFNRLWNDSLPKLEKALTLKDEIKQAPDHAFFSKDKVSLTKDFNEILDGLSIILSERSLSELQDKMAQLKGDIKSRRDDIAQYKENRLGAPLEHMVKTTKSGYDAKIASAQADIVGYEAGIVSLKESFSRELKSYGINLTPAQTDVLLTRVDANDILQMTMVFDSVKGITSKLMQLTSDSGEDIQYAKKYYGLHVVLVELIVHMQNGYLTQVTQRYLPKLEEIISRTRAVSSEARRELRREKQPSRRQIYQANLSAHDLTIKTAKLYAKALSQQQGKVASARQKALRDLALAKNTLETVMVSADLLGLLQSSQKTFKALLNLQVPELVPFKNLAMRKKFEELSTLLAK
ncbi:MAG: hypothetical protein HQL72_11315 [Magnetococcales bacterium]|nr:hypothetical protein [Magnetococcales bacterium]